MSVISRVIEVKPDGREFYAEVLSGNNVLLGQTPSVGSQEKARALGFSLAERFGDKEVALLDQMEDQMNLFHAFFIEEQNPTLCESLHTVLRALDQLADDLRATGLIKEESK